MHTASDKIKVLHIITRFDKGGSAENTFLTVCGLGKGRYEVVLAAGAGGNKNGAAIPKTKEKGFIRTKEAAVQTDCQDDPESLATAENIAAVRASGARLVFVRHLARELNLFRDLAAFFSLCGMIRREKPDIVHTHTSKAGFLGRWAAWLCRVPVIIHTPHGHVFHGYFGPAKTRLFVILERWTAKITDALVMLTPQEMKEHLALRIAPSEKFTVIHSGVDLTRFAPRQFRLEENRAAMNANPSERASARDSAEDRKARAEGRHPEDQGVLRPHQKGRHAGTIKKEIFKDIDGIEGRTVIGTVGRLTAIKGQDVLLAAFAELVRGRDDVFLVLVGEGERRGELEERARRLEVYENIRFLGWRPDVAAVMASFDIFCLPSLNEGMGKVIVEAMAMGLPVVASEIGGIKDLVRNGENGLLVPPGDAHALAGALMRLCRDPESRLRMGEVGRKSAAFYSVPAMLTKIEKLYETSFA